MDVDRRSVHAQSQFPTPNRASAVHALRLSMKDCGDYTVFERCMGQATAKRMTWVQGLEYTVSVLKDP